jgi:hypothetical protein
VGLTILVMILPGGAMISVPMIAKGITGIRLTPDDELDEPSTQEARPVNFVAQTVDKTDTRANELVEGCPSTTTRPARR